MCVLGVAIPSEGWRSGYRTSWVALPRRDSRRGFIGAVVQPAQTWVQESRVQPQGAAGCLPLGSCSDAHLPPDLLSSPLFPRTRCYGQPAPAGSPFPSLPPAGMFSPPLLKPQPDCGLLHDPCSLYRAPAAFPGHLICVAFNICRLVLLLFRETYLSPGPVPSYRTFRGDERCPMW